MSDDAADARGAFSGLDAFLDARESTPELLRETLWRLVDAVKDTTRTSRRAIFTLWSAAALFELISRNLLSEASFAGVKLSRLDFLTLFLPVAVAYLMLRFMSNGRNLAVYTGTLYAVARRGFPGMYRSDLDRVLVAVGGYTTVWMPVSYSRHLKKTELLAVFVELSTAGAAPPAFLSYAYWRLFSVRGPDDVGVWLSLAAALLLIVLAAAFASIGIRITAELATRERGELSAALRRHRKP
jgi:hypothetical protein